MRRYNAIPFTAVRLDGAFWTERVTTVLRTTIPSQYAKLRETGMLDAMKRNDAPPPVSIPRQKSGFTTEIFWDSDVGKWIEAASYALAHQRNATIEAQIDAIVADLADAQAPDGYLNMWYLRREPQNRWTNLRDNHELYCAGHMLEGALAYFQSTGRRLFLDVMERYIDHIRTLFGTGPGQKRGYPGHQELELALIKLFHATGDRRHLDLASYFIDERGASPHYFVEEAKARNEPAGAFHQGTMEYNQSHKPVRAQDKVVGHAVRAMYMYTAMADLAADKDDAALREACEVLWHDVVDRRMYVTGGFGPNAGNEGFTEDYDLPNATAYAETCASVAMVFWAQRMLNLRLDGQYCDILELALYNGALVGLSRHGDTYFYDNPLESDGSHQRWHWHPCPCCTMNVARLIASVAGYFYSTGPGILAVHLYGGATATVEVSGTRVELVEVSDYPWSGAIRLTVNPAMPADFSLRLRIPGWASGVTATVNGDPVDCAALTRDGYLGLRRVWTAGDVVTLDLPMPAERLYAHPLVHIDKGAVALRRGPLIYCVEAADHAGLDVSMLFLPRDAELTVNALGDFDGAMAVRAQALVTNPDAWQSPLYATTPPVRSAVALTAIPYFLWNNRGKGGMQVWLREA